MVIYIYLIFITDIESIKSSYGASILEKAALKWVFALYDLWGIFIDSFSNPKTVISNSSSFSSKVRYEVECKAGMAFIPLYNHTELKLSIKSAQRMTGYPR